MAVHLTMGLRENCKLILQNWGSSMLKLQILGLHKSERSPMGGFSLVEMAMVLLIVGLIVGTSLKAGVAYISIEKRKVTSARLSAVDSALVNYVAQNRRLPCPADGAIASGNANAGVEGRIAGVCPSVNRGVVPWVTLGIPESDAQDGWFNRITYSVPSATVIVPNIGFTSDQALDMTNCDPAGSAPRVDRPIGGQNVSTCVQNLVGTCEKNNVAGCTSADNYLKGRGIEIRDGVGGNILMDTTTGMGAAYVLISHGDNAAGAYSSSGVILPANGIAASAMENRNANNVRIQGYYIDAAQNLNAASATYFDDLLSRPSLNSVISRAQLGARAH